MEPEPPVGNTSGRAAASVGVGLDESEKIVERKHEAMAAVRLVDADGDVIWSTTQESLGAKFKGASADVADKVVKQLLADIEKARRPDNAPASRSAALIRRVSPRSLAAHDLHVPLRHTELVGQELADLFAFPFQERR